MRVAAVMAGVLYGLVDGALVVAIVVGVALLGKRVQERTAVQYVPPAAPVFSGTWRVSSVEEALLVAAMRGGHHCWVYTPLGLDATRLSARVLRSSALCGSR